MDVLAANRLGYALLHRVRSPAPPRAQLRPLRLPRGDRPQSVRRLGEGAPGRAAVDEFERAAGPHRDSPHTPVPRTLLAAHRR
ncbi:hypothetical protein [Streptomyces canus]|uniref:hypothetical protein n=1 Tax=Streptomyces canus TaxID=58343 RepID=UPI00358F0995